MPKYDHYKLIDATAVRGVVSALGDVSDAHVVEIGPGTGVLSVELAPRCKRLTLIDVDPGRVPQLRAMFKDRPNVAVVHGDFVHMDHAATTAGPERLLVCGNLPYSVATPILQRTLALETWERAVFMFQKEVAQRIVAEPGSRQYSTLSLSVRVRATAAYLYDVPPEAFKPQPKVDSAVVRLDRRPEPLLDPAEEQAFFRVVKAAFHQRRRKVSNPLAHHFQLEREDVEERLRGIGVDPGLRPERLTFEEFLKIARAFS